MAALPVARIFVMVAAEVAEGVKSNNSKIIPKKGFRKVWQVCILTSCCIHYCVNECLVEFENNFIGITADWIDSHCLRTDN